MHVSTSRNRCTLSDRHPLIEVHLLGSKDTKMAGESVLCDCLTTRLFVLHCLSHEHMQRAELHS
jgi:hypothetical protein